MSEDPPSDLPSITRTTPDMRLVNRWYRETFGTRPTRDHSQDKSAWAVKDEDRRSNNKKGRKQ